METLEARNLNRLRNGKMMLAYGKEKKSYGVTLLLTLFAGWFGAHRFYLGHKHIGFAYIVTAVIAVIGMMTVGSVEYHPVGFIGELLTMLLSIAVIIEILLSFWVVGRENERIKTRLSVEYGVEDWKVSL